MREIMCRVRADGTMSVEGEPTPRIGVKGDKACTTLVFEIDEAIEGRFRYAIFKMGARTVLQSLGARRVVVSPNVTAYSGTWHLSFLSSDKAVTYEGAKGSYLFSTVPVATEVSDGLTEIDAEGEKDKEIAELRAELDAMGIFIAEIVGMSYTDLEIPEYATEVGDYFLYNSKVDIPTLTIGENVERIGNYAFYGCTIEKIEFWRSTRLAELGDHAFAHVDTGDIVFPASLSEYGHYAFNGGSVSSIEFESGSQLRTLNANAFNGMHCGTVVLPDGLTKIAANGYVFRDCSMEQVQLPATLTSPVAQTTFHPSVQIASIVLRKGFNVSANISNVPQPRVRLVDMFNNLADRTGQDPLSITIGDDNLAKLTDEDIAIATAKNWTVS